MPDRDDGMDDDSRTSAERALAESRVGSTAWRDFEKGLSEVLGVLEEDQFLVISAKRGWAYVQFAGQGSFGIRAESVSNNFLSGSDALGADQIEALQKLGWSSPTGLPGEGAAKREPGGSPNFFRDFARPVPFQDVARLAVRTLTEVHGMPHPGFLEYQAFDTDRRSILMPTLGLKVRPSAPRPAKAPSNTIGRVRGLVLEAIRKASGNADLDFDEDGRLALRFGSAVVIVRVQKDPFCVSVTSPLLRKIETNDALTERLNDLNAKVRFARLFVREGIVYAAVEVSASPFVAEHVVSACELLGNLADHIDGMLQWEFGGRTAFGEFRSKPLIH